MVEVVSRPSVAFSKRKLITNYYKDLGKEKTDELIIHEKVTDSNYLLVKELFENKCQYIIMREFGIDCFSELITDTKNYISNGCIDDNYVNKYKKLGDSTNFFFKKTIYKVKK